MHPARPTKPRAVPERAGVYRFPTGAAPRVATPVEPSWERVVAAAGAAGIGQFGVAPVDPFTHARAVFERWLGQGLHGTLGYLEGEPRWEPKALLPEAQSLIVIAVPYVRRPDSPSETDRRARVANYALGRDYHHVLRSKLLDLGEQLAIALGRELLGRICVDSAPLLEREAASRAGLGFTGKSTLQIVPGLGSTVLLGELLLDAALPRAATVAGPSPSQGCGECTRCLDACPTGAFLGPYVLDARRCISYLTIESHDSIPRELRSRMGTHVFGCDVCQEVCPWNHSRKPPEPDPGLLPRKELSAPELLDVLELGSASYRRFVRRSALRRTKRELLQRNAAVGLGNVAFETGAEQAAAVAALTRALAQNRSTLVRAHAAWALGRIGTREALQALDAALASEPDEGVRDEVRAALAERNSQPERPPTRSGIELCE